MSKIIPFPALLPNKEIVDKIICPPYDIIDTKEAKAIAKDNPYSLLHVTKAEIDCDNGLNPYDEKVYEKAKYNFFQFLQDGFLFRDKPSIYVYQMTMGNHTQTGIVCGVSAEEYKNGLIKKHEHTKKDKEDDRTKLIYTLEAQTEPVILVHKTTNNDIKNLIANETEKKPLYEVTDMYNVKHILWRVDAESSLISEFEKLDSLYIADGHHRSASALRVKNMLEESNSNVIKKDYYKFYPAVIFPQDEVLVFEYDWQGDPKQRPLAKHQMKDIIKISDNNEVMPPKSTWFAPKLTSGLFIYPFD